MEMIKHDIIENRIFNIRGEQVMFDYHLAELYGVETKRVNEQVKRNLERFPASFMFQLTQQEWDDLRSQFATAENDKNTLPNSDGRLQSQFATAKRRTLPYAFTEQGVAMLSAVLRSETAVQISIKIIQAFVKFRQLVNTNALASHRIDRMERKQLETDQKIDLLFNALENKNPKPDKGIFFNGQVYDAYVFVNDIIKSAEKSIILIDNYIDETVLTLLSKRNPKVEATVYTRQVNKQLQLDLKKHRAQYPEIHIKTLKNSHDRFLVIDNSQLYHIGASLKDLGKHWFAFSRMDSLVNEMLQKIEEDGTK